MSMVPIQSQETHKSVFRNPFLYAWRGLLCPLKVIKRCFRQACVIMKRWRKGRTHVEINTQNAISSLKTHWSLFSLIYWRALSSSWRNPFIQKHSYVKCGWVGYIVSPFQLIIVHLNISSWGMFLLRGDRCSLYQSGRVSWSVKSQGLDQRRHSGR